MAISFPGTIDAFTNPAGTTLFTALDHAGQHSDSNDAIEAIEAKVGVNSSTVSTSLDYKVARLGTSPVNVKAAYNALGNGTADDAAALGSALTAGGNIYIPAGTYTIGTNLAFTSNSYIHGDGRGKTIIKLKNGATIPVSSSGLIQGSGTTSNVTIAHLSIDGNYGSATGTYGCIQFASVIDGLLFDVEAYGASEVGINPSGNASIAGTYPTMKIVNCFAHNNNTDGIQMGNASLIGCHSWANTQVGIKVAGGGAGSVPNHFEIIGCTAHKNSSHGISIEEQVGGSVEVGVVADCWSMGNGVDGIVLNLAGITVSNSISANNGSIGVRVAQSDCKLIGNTIKNNAGMGIQISGDRYNNQVIANRCYDDQTSKTQTYGIGESGGASSGTGNIIAYNVVSGNLTGALDGISTRGANYLIYGNPGYNPVGAASISPGASPYTYTAGASPEDVYIRGGTVSAVVIAGVTLFAATGCTIHLEPGGTTVITYSAAPTMSKYIS